MKTLQNNFTTPKQSKRLLELGVPADSADCYWTEFPLYEGKFRGYEHKPQWLYDDEKFSKLQSYCKTRILACWSVGRLMEIYLMCVKEPTTPEVIGCEIDFSLTSGVEVPDLVHYIITWLEYYVEKKQADFSELEK